MCITCGGDLDANGVEVFLYTGWVPNASQMETENHSSLAMTAHDVGIQAAMTGVLGTGCFFSFSDNPHPSLNSANFLHLE